MKMLDVCDVEVQKPLDGLLSYDAVSQFVVTTSFHGTSFAVNFHKEFYAVNTGKPNERILSLLQLTGLEDKYIHSIDDVDDKYIDFLVVSEKLQNEKTKSFSFIVNSMGLSEV